MNKQWNDEECHRKTCVSVSIIIQYLYLNSHIYLTDEMKILFVLFFCTEGHAANWAKFIYMKYTTNPYPEWAVFQMLFLGHFRSHNIEGEAHLQLAQMHQGSDDIVAFNSKFTTIAYHANLNDDTDIHYYMHAIKPALCSQILNMDMVLTMIQKWQEKATLFDVHWCYNKEIKKERTL